MHRIKWLSYYGERAGVLQTNRIQCAQFEKGEESWRVSRLVFTEKHQVTQGSASILEAV